ncbi:hypothetical protein B2G71_16980 [Novosphingobium sp. PC22D]|uniref:substrate-binding domain-containing protein n=1 Tax=Novosphingobium sp. PC22D TaxID=1962403 RepID=UPI000BEF4F70|nr:substrate-binding domain-containing protein [Novosphingobium sp. PC22D]PEQ11521.1 hypothetical protein B2G71_16980 [Novosphingobium sp. PC22D]
MIALVCDRIDPVPLGEAVQALADVVQAAGQVLGFCLLTEPRDEALHAFIARHQPDALVLMPDLAEPQALAAIAHDLRCPCIGGDMLDAESLRVDRLGMFGLVAWIIGRGHRRVAYIGGPEGSPAARQRELGYLDAMAEYELDRGPALIEDGDGTFASGVVAARLLFELSPRPSAIVAANDAMAAGALHAAVELGISVPGQVSIAGFGNEASGAATSPPLASVSLPWNRALRRTASALLLPDAPSLGKVALEPRIIPRGSVADWG